MKTYENRNEINEEYKWDLSSLYLNDELWEEDFKKAQAMAGKMSDFQGRVLESAQTLFAVIEAELELNRVVSNVVTYANMKSHEDANDSEYQGKAQRSEGLAVQVGEAVSFIVPEIMSKDAEVVKGYVESFEGLKLYKQYLSDILRTKAHVLSTAEETILAQAGELAQAPESIFGMLNTADMTFPDVKNGKGETVKLTHGNFVPLLESKERDVRENVFKTYYKEYDKLKNTIGTALASEVKKNVFFSKARKYETSRAAALFANNVPESVYDNLIDAVNANLPSMHKYMALRKRILGVDELHMYDVYTPIVKDVEMTIPYEEAKDIVLKSLSPLGKDYTDVVERSFKENWIDVYENKGKRSGAYSWGTYDSKPYILLNHHDTLDNMFTLTHEMGHSMHSYLTRENQPYVYGGYSIFVAEVASTTNEALLNNYLLETLEDKQEKLFVLNHYLEQFRGTVYRQTMFAEYERDIHAAAERGEALTADSLSKMYKALNEKYYGPSMISDDEIALEWARIPHFYYNFYVFQYATGFSAAIALSKKILEEGEKATEDYLSFLKAGNSDYPINVLRKAGVDMETKEPVDLALKLFGELVDEMEKLLDEA